MPAARLFCASWAALACAAVPVRSLFIRYSSQVEIGLLQSSLRALSKLDFNYCRYTSRSDHALAL